MSLFDVIKYPISDPPTFDELNALPEDLFSKWCNRVFQFARTPKRALTILDANYTITYSLYMHRVNSLRQIIKDYDESI